jgi:UDP-glucuronate 4-epimerase
MIILVTGCAGFIGSHLCEKLLKDTNIVVIGLDNINDYYDINQKLDNLYILKKYTNFIFEQQDIINTNIINEKKPDIVIHLAALAGVRNSINNPTSYIRNNIEGHTNLIEQSVKNNVKLFIYASSSSVYGNNVKVPYNEDDNINNLNSPYALTKYTCENISKLYSKLYDISTIGLRFFTVYGPRGRPDMAPYKFLHKLINNEKIDKYGDGSSYRDYTYIDDIVNGILGAVKNKNNVKCEIYNLGNSKTYSLNDFIQICEKTTNKKAIINYMDDQKGDVEKTYSNINKAKQDLDYNPKVNLEEGLKYMYDWLINKQNNNIFNKKIDNEINDIIATISSVKDYTENDLNYDVSFTEQDLKKIFNNNYSNYTIFYSKSGSFNQIIICNDNNKITIEFENTYYELCNKGLNNQLQLL